MILTKPNFPGACQNSNSTSTSRREKKTPWITATINTNSTNKKKEFEQEEYYLKDHFENVIQALDLFKNDPLIYKPGTSLFSSLYEQVLL